MVTFAPPVLDSAETEVLAQVDEAQIRLGRLIREPSGWSTFMGQAAFARNLQASMAIEGSHVSIDDALAAVEGLLPVDASGSDWAAVTGYWDASSYVVQLGDDPEFVYDSSLFRALHFMMQRHTETADPGLYRSGGISVGGGELADVVFEDVPGLINNVVAALTDHPAGDSAVTRSAMTHLNIVGIRPFKTGNGSIARLLQTLVLTRECDGPAQFWSIEEYLGVNSAEYFEVLAQVAGERDARPWLRFVLLAHFRHCFAWINRLVESERLWQAIDSAGERMGLASRNLGSLHRAALGLRVRRPDYILGAGVGERVASADLKGLVDAGLLNTVGDRRGRFYVAGQRLKRIRGSVQESPPRIPDPFL